MTLDEQSEAARARAIEMGVPALHTISPVEARARELADITNWGPSIYMHKDYLIPGADGMLTARVYSPTDRAASPLMVWFHGGGWVQGGVAQTDSIVRQIAVGSGCIVVSVGYRLAPETKFPHLVEDCYAATRWVSRNAEVLGSEASKIAVGGYSAGGNLAAAVSIMARDRKEFDLCAQLLLCPVLDRDFTRPSYIAYGDGYGLTMKSMEWYWDHYLKEAAHGMNPYAAPLQCNDLSSLPEALIITADHDPLCDEGDAYAARLAESGVPVKLSQYLGVMHGFVSMSDTIDQGMDALRETAQFLKETFSD